MKIEQIYTDCLAQASYFISSENEALVIDPIREVDKYLEMAKKENVNIRYIFETHFHADFVSGHLELAKKTNAEIVFGPNAKTAYQSTSASDGQIFNIGKISIQVLHTPGHTPESSCFLLRDKNGKEHAIFTGDTLFVGDVGRPDLAVSTTVTDRDLAALLYDSIHGKLVQLNDELIVYPGHGAGSSCGKNLGKERFSTIGEQKETNYALSEISKEDFINKLVNDIPSAPKYFSFDAQLNKQGYTPLENILAKSFHKISTEMFKSRFSKATVLDCRTAEEFAKGFIPGSINIGLNGQFAIWAGSLLDFNKNILLLVNNENDARSAIIRLARVGIHSVIGFLEGGFEKWRLKEKTYDSVYSLEWKDISMTEQDTIIDLRTESERSAGYIKYSIHIPLEQLESKLSELEKDQHYLLYCAGGYRSMIAISILQKNQFRKVKNIYGGFSALEKENNKIIVETL